MHFKLLVEDRSGGIAVDVLLEKILGANGEKHSWKLHSYRGIGHIPKDLHRESDPAKRLLLDRLPQILQGYGRSLDDSTAVVVVVDPDRNRSPSFRAFRDGLRRLAGAAPRAGETA